MDFEEAEQGYQLGPSHNLAPEALFDAEWARTLIEAALSELEGEFGSSGKSDVFERLRGSLSALKADLPYKDLGEELDMSEGAVKVTVHRMRRRYGELLRNEIAKIVERPEDIDGELKYLIEVAGH